MTREPRHSKNEEARIAVRIEYVGIIAIVCLFAGMLIGGSIGGRSEVASAQQASQHEHDHDADAAPPGTASTEVALAAIQNETNRERLVEMGNHAYDNGRPDIAIPAYEKALTYQPNDPNVLTDLAAMYVADNRYDRAVELAKKAASMDDRHPNSRYWLGVALAGTGDKAGARKAFLEVKRIAPGQEISAEADKQIVKLGG